MIEIVNARLEDADEVMSLVNEAYLVELGDSGVACKNALRLLDALEPSIQTAYSEGRAIKCLSKQSDGSTVIGDGVISFGPFAVRKEFNGKGLGKALVSKVEDIGRQKKMTQIDIFILNHRADLFPLYEKWGFSNTGRVVDYPYPDRLTRPS
eukprot:gene35867-46557_t